MLSMVFTGHHLLASRREKFTRDASEWILADADRLFQAKRCLQICPPDEEHEMVSASIMVTVPQNGGILLFGLLDMSQLPVTQPSPGVCIALDLSVGAVCDVMNGTSVLGYVDEGKLLPGEQISVEFELQSFGETVIPKIRIGSEELLHPALQLARLEILDLLVGASITQGAPVHVERAGEGSRAKSPAADSAVSLS
jgi:hypothetical protein